MEDYEARFLMSGLPGFCGNKNTNLEKPCIKLWPTDIIIIIVIVMGLLSFPFHSNCWEIRFNLHIDLVRCHHISFQNGNSIVVRGLCSIRLVQPELREINVPVAENYFFFNFVKENKPSVGTCSSKKNSSEVQSQSINLLFSKHSGDSSPNILWVENAFQKQGKLLLGFVPLSFL